MADLTTLEMSALAAGLLALGIVLVVLSRFYWRWRLERWAAGEGYRLVSFRGAATWEGPQKFLRSENQSLFRVEVEDARGARRGAWVMFGSYWGFVIGEPIDGVTWD